MSLADSLLLDPYPFEIWVAIRSDSQAGSGTLNDPYSGSHFDEVMRALPSTPALRVHLGPGTYLTQGYYDGADQNYGWQPKPGMQITGAGMDVTTIQLVNNLAANNHYFAIGHALANNGQPNALHFCEVSDLTIDCNLQNQSNTVACGAVRLMGNHVRIRRVKAVNWGNMISNKVGFVLAVILADPDTGITSTDAGIENCVAVQLPDNPATTTAGEVLILHAGGKDYDATQNLEAYGLGPFIRNCFVDCDPSGSLGSGTDYHSFFRGLSMSSCRGGVAEGNQIHNTWYGGPYLTKWSVRDFIVRNNFYKNVVRGPYLNLPAPGTGISITGFSLPDSSATVEATTQSIHKLTAGDRVKVTQGTDPLLNGVFVVSLVTATNKFQYVAAARPNPAGTGTMQKVLGIENVLIEANTVELAPFKTGSNIPIAFYFNANSGGAQPLAYVYGSAVIRQNKVRYLDGQFDSGFLGYALNVYATRNLLVFDSVVESAPSLLPLQNSTCGSVKYFNNKTPSGILIQGVNNDQSQKKYDELATDAEDAFLVALLRRI